MDYIAYIYSWTLTEMGEIQSCASAAEGKVNKTELFMFTERNRDINFNE